MAQDGRLILTLLGPDGAPLEGKVDIFLEHQVLSDRRAIRDADAAKKIVITELHRIPQGLYRLRVEPTGFRAAARFVNIAPSGDTEVELTFRDRTTSEEDNMEDEKKHDLERERVEFKSLLAENPNFFGNVTDKALAEEFAPVVPIAGNTRYEQLRCVGLYPEDDVLEAVLEIKLPFGYQGGLCSEGSKEYVAFYVDWEDGNGFVSVGAPAQVRVHDLAAAAERDLFYAVRKPFTTKERLKCKTPQVVRVRAILSWEQIPTGPGYVPVWGNVVDVWVQIKPKAKLSVIPAPHFGLEIQPLVPEQLVLAGTKEEIKEIVDFSLAEEQRIEEAGEVESHRFGFKALVAENPNHFGSISESGESEDLLAAIAELPSTAAGYLTDKLAVDPALLKPILPFLKKTKYEQLRCVGLYPEEDLLEAIIEIKRPTGYNGSLCSFGSNEYVVFYIDWGSGYQYAATAQVRVHDIPEVADHHLFYAVQAKIPNPKLKPCTYENVVRVKAILQWNFDPTLFGPGYTPSWGNVLVRDVQIRPKDGASAKCDLEIVNGIHTDDIDGNGLAIKIDNGGLTVPGTYDRPFGGVIAAWGNINVSGAHYYRFWYKEEPAGPWTLVKDKRRARGFGGVTLFRAPDANGWFSRSLYETDEANYSLTALVHWSSHGKNGEYRFRLELGDAAKNPLPNPCEVTLELDNVGPELLEFSGTPAPLPAKGVAVKDAGGNYKKCGTFVGPEPIRVFGNFLDEYFRNYHLRVFGGNIHVSGVSIGSGRYDGGLPLNDHGIVGAVSGVAGPGQELTTINLCTVPQSPQKVKCAYGIELRVWDRAIVGGLSGYQYNTSAHRRSAFVTFDWDPTGC